MKGARAEVDKPNSKYHDEVRLSRRPEQSREQRFCVKVLFSRVLASRTLQSIKAQVCLHRLPYKICHVETPRLVLIRKSDAPHSGLCTLASAIDTLFASC